MAEKALVVIPTYNECENLPHIAPRVLDADDRIEILVVDDGSPDGTGDLADSMSAENPRIHAIHRSSKQGLGTAYIAGFKWALERDYDYVFEMDADFSHDPKHLVEFLEAIKDADLVLGCRYLQRRVTVINWPMSRLVLSYAANVYARIVTGNKLWDATGGFKCFRRRVLETIDLDAVTSNGYAFQIEMSYRARRRGFKIKEIPIIFSDRIDGTSKMSNKIVREAVWMVWWLRIQAIFRRI